jgi:tetratricopeptide (TPR) repeat protein
LGLIEGIVYLQQDEFIEARKRLLQVLETEPGNGQALLSLGDVYLRLADWDQATIYFELAQMYPDFAYDALYSHAQLLLGLGQTEDALEKLREANGMEGHGDLTELIRSIEETGRLLR